MKYQVFKAFIAIFFIAGIVSCKKSDNKEPLKAQDEIDLSYGLHEQHKLDVYLPAGRSDTTQTIILLHGEGWSAGDKDTLTEIAIYYRDKGFAVVNMNYRLTNTPEDNTHPAQELDIADAVNFVASKAIDWHISANKFGIAGVSAGAHLALLYTYAFNADGRIKTVVSLAGPTNFTDTENIGLSQAAAVQALIGEDFNDDNLSYYIQASPLAKASPLSKPTLIFHGDYDNIVPIKQSVDLHNALKAHGLKDDDNELVYLHAVGHEILTASNKKEVLDKIENWFRKKIK
jgi:dipeptidyl aminopeptidase/acylaminoacyl peptidase